MSRVLFTQSYLYPLDQKQWKFREPYPPLGTLQAASVVRQAGFTTSFADMGLQEEPEAIQSHLLKFKPDYFVIYDDGFNYLTKMCLTVMREAAFRMAALAKRQSCVVVICSSDSSDHFGKYLEQGVDFVVRGEGEETLRALLLCLDKKEDPFTIPGLALQRQGAITVTGTRPVMRDLDLLPLPAWDLVDLEPYRKIWMEKHGYFSLNVATTRGCPYKCNWCAKPIYGNRYNSRSPKHVVDEMAYLKSTFNPDHFWMCDDIFGLKPAWVRAFNEELKKKSLSVRYKIQSRVDLLLEDNTISELSESGCETVWVGAESGSQKILDAMDKGTRVEQIRTATRILKQHGIRVGYFLQFGYPGEGKADIDATLNMVLNEMPDEIGISVAYPLPGTRFYERVQTELSEKQNWTDSDDLALMFRNTYPPSFYKVLHRYIHSRYRIQRGWVRLKNFSKQPHSFSRDARKLASMAYHLPLALLQAVQLRRLSAPRVNSQASWRS